MNTLKSNKMTPLFQNWSIKFDQDQPVAPRFDENAPDLYIPGMTANILL